MAITHMGSKVPFAITPILPLKNAPPGRVRIRQRNNSFTKVYFKTENSIRCFVPIIEDGHWVINESLEQGRNVRC